MPKMKSHGGISKKINVRNSGSMSVMHPGGNHNTGKKNTKFNRKNRTASELSKSFESKYKNVL